MAGFSRPVDWHCRPAAPMHRPIDRIMRWLRRALDVTLNAGNPMKAARAMPVVIAFLRGHGFNAQAGVLEKEATQRLAAVGMTLHAMPGLGSRSLPPTCPQCAGPLRSDNAEWIDATSVECPWCGSTVKTV